MFAAFDDLAIVDHQHHVRIADGAQPVGDDKTGAPFKQRGQGFLDQAFGAGVHAGSGLIQDQDARVGQGCPGDREQLALSLAEAGAALAQDGLIFLRQALDECIGVGQFCRSITLLRRGASGLPKRIFSITVVLKRKVSCSTMPSCLRRDSAVHRPDVDPVDQDFAAGDIVKAGQQVDDGGLACAGWSDDGDRLARLRLEIDVLKHRLAFFIFCGDIHELDFAADGGQGFGIRGILYGGRLIQQSEDAFRAGNRALDVGPQDRDLLDGLVEALDVARKVITRPSETAVPNSVPFPSRASPPAQVTIARARYPNAWSVGARAAEKATAPTFASR